MLNIFAWNCRGAGPCYFSRLVRDLKYKYSIHVLIIVEPRVSGQRVESIIAKLRFQNNFRVEAEGFSGGIWVLWEGDIVNVDIISTSNQFIHYGVSFKDGSESFFLTCLYGSPIPSIRQDLWNNLETLSTAVGNNKWCCIGDFNEYKGLEDKQGGVSPIVKTMSDFNNCCINCILMDLSFCGPKFTWKNGKVQERLDWALANFNCFTHFNDAYLEHLNWFKSDHKPILLVLGREEEGS